MKKGFLIAGIAVAAVAAVVALTITVFIPLTKYNNAKTALQEGRYDEAIAAFAALGDYRDSTVKLMESRYGEAMTILEKGQHDRAMELFSALGTYRDSPQLYRKARYQWGLALTEAGEYREALKQFAQDIDYEGARDGIRRVYNLASLEGKPSVAFDAAVTLRDFEDIAQLNLQIISAGRNHLVALRRDGTVVAAGNNEEGQCDVQSWTDVISVAAGYNYTVGLRADGTVVATGFNNNGQCNVQGWTGIAAIYAGNTATDTVGVKADGTIVSTGSLEGKTYYKEIPEKGDGMVEVCPGWSGILAVMDHGSVRYIHKLDNLDGIEDWMGVTHAAIGTDHAVGVLFDGTVATAGRNTSGQNDVQDWTHIVAISASNSNTAGLKTDGTVVVAGSNDKGQLDTQQWTDVVAISVGPGFVVGLRIDGSVAVAGTIVGGTTPARMEENRKAMETIAQWRDIGPLS